jgi:PTH1 family peptidyl-tRNA hydrolase
MTTEPRRDLPIKLIVGLGNPGRRYAKTRHNVGFMVVDELARRSGSRGWREERLASVSEAVLGSDTLVLVKPQTFMNLSGHAVVAYSTRTRAEPESILVVGDDLDLPFGRLRLRPGGSAGGHNGLRSIAAELQTDGFARLRVGIGRPDDGDAIDYVLAPFSSEEFVHLPTIVETACEMATAAVESGLLVAMNQFNGRANVLDTKDDLGSRPGMATRSQAEVDREHG